MKKLSINTDIIEYFKNLIKLDNKVCQKDRQNSINKDKLINICKQILKEIKKTINSASSNLNYANLINYFEIKQIIYNDEFFFQMYDYYWSGLLYFNDSIASNLDELKSLSHQSFKSKKSILDEIEEEYLKIFQLEISYFQEAVTQYRKMKLENKQFIESFFQGSLDIQHYNVPQEIKEMLLSRQKRLGNNKFKFSQFLNPLLKKQIKKIVEQNKKKGNNKRSILQKDQVKNERIQNKRAGLQIIKTKDQEESNFRQENVIRVEYDKEKLDQQLTETQVEQIDDNTKIIKKQELQKIELQPSNKLPLMASTRPKRKTTARKQKKPEIQDLEQNEEDEELNQETNQNQINKTSDRDVEKQELQIKKLNESTLIETESQLTELVSNKNKNINLSENKQTQNTNNKNIKQSNQKSKSKLKVKKKQEKDTKNKKQNQQRSDSYNIRKQKKKAEKNDKNFNKMILKNKQNKKEEYFVTMEDNHNQQNIQKVTDSRIDHNIDTHGSLDFNEKDKKKNKKAKKNIQGKHETQQNLGQKKNTKSKSNLNKQKSKSKINQNKDQIKNKLNKQNVKNKSKANLNQAKDKSIIKKQKIQTTQTKPQKGILKKSDQKQKKHNLNKTQTSIKTKTSKNLKKAKSALNLKKNKNVLKNKFQASTTQLLNKSLPKVNQSIEEMNFKNYNGLDINSSNEQKQAQEFISSKNKLDQTLPQKRQAVSFSQQKPENTDIQNKETKKPQINDNNDDNNIVSFRNFERSNRRQLVKQNLEQNQGIEKSKIKSLMQKSSNKNIFLYPKQQNIISRSFDKNFQIQQNNKNIFSSDKFEDSINIGRPKSQNKLQNIQNRSLNLNKIKHDYSIKENYSLNQFLDTTSFKSQDIQNDYQQKQIDQMTSKQSFMQSSSQNQDVNKMLLEQNILLINQLIQDKDKMSRMYENLQSQMNQMNENFQNLKDKKPIIIKQTDQITNNNYVEKHLIEETRNNNYQQQHHNSQNFQKQDFSSNQKNNNNQQFQSSSQKDNKSQSNDSKFDTIQIQGENKLNRTDQNSVSKNDTNNDQQHQISQQQTNKKSQYSEKQQINLSQQQNINHLNNETQVQSEQMQKYLQDQQNKLQNSQSEFGSYLDGNDKEDFQNPYSHLQSIESQTNNSLDQIQRMLESLQKINQKDDDLQEQSKQEDQGQQRQFGNTSSDFFQDNINNRQNLFGKKQQNDIQNKYDNNQQQNHSKNNDQNQINTKHRKTAQFQNLVNSNQDNLIKNQDNLDNKLVQINDQTNQYQKQGQNINNRIDNNQKDITQNNTYEKNKQNINEQQTNDLQQYQEKNKNNQKSYNNEFDQNEDQNNKYQENLQKRTDITTEKKSIQQVQQNQNNTKEGNSKFTEQQSKVDQNSNFQQNNQEEQQFQELEDNKFFTHFYENILQKENNFDKELNSFTTDRIKMSKKSKLQFIYYMIQRFFMKIIVYSSKIKQMKTNEGLDNIVETVFKTFAKQQNFWGFLEFNNFIDSLQYHLVLSQRKRVFYYLSQIKYQKQNHISMQDFKKAFGNIKVNQQNFYYDTQNQKEIQKRDFHIMRRLVIFYLKKYEDINRIVNFLNLLSTDLIFYLITGELNKSSITKDDLKQFFTRNEMYILEQDYNLILNELYCIDTINKQDFVNYLRMNIFRIRNQSNNQFRK